MGSQMCKIKKDEVWGLEADERGSGRDLNHLSAAP